MPVIVLASSKGGAGKTTACVVLACELARQGLPKNIGVSLIDADPNQHTAAWAQLEGKPENITLITNVTESDIIDVIEEAQAKTLFVIVDLEGVASSAVVGAVSRADLVIIPCQPSQNDAKEAAKTIKTIKYGARVARREIPFAVLFTRISAAIITRTGKHLIAEFDGAGVDVFKCSLVEREAFRSIFSFGGSVNNLEATTSAAQASIDKGADNARLFTEEVKQYLRRTIKQRKQQKAGDSDEQQ